MFVADFFKVMGRNKPRLEKRTEQDVMLSRCHENNLSPSVVRIL
jgi:hypothetical protein